MRFRMALGVILTLGCLAAGPRPVDRAPIASHPVVEIKGKIARVQAAPGQGMPALEVEQNGRTVRVLLGSLRYLMEQDFNPKAGSQVEVKGYRTAEEIVAITVTLPGEGKTVRLRDEGGWPVWAGCRRK